MNYFKILGIAFGVMAMLKPFYMHLIPWDENKYIAKAYAEKRPQWIIYVAIVGLLLVAFTWYKELTTATPYSLILTILFSITAVKALVLLLDYKNFHKWIAGMLSKDRGKRIVLIDMAVGLFGAIVIAGSLILY